jgi:transcriptional regulator with XRE-family HTH domain
MLPSDSARLLLRRQSAAACRVSKTVSLLGTYVRNARLAMGLSPQSLAARVGYGNVDKGARRIAELERSGAAHPELLRKFVAALGLDPGELARLAASDQAQMQAQFDAWCAQAVEPALYLLPLLAVPVRVPLPEPIRHDRDAAAAHALERAQQHGFRVCLVWSRRESYWIAHDRGSARGVWIETTLQRANSPEVRLRGRALGFVFE